MKNYYNERLVSVEKLYKEEEYGKIIFKMKLLFKINMNLTIN